MTEKVVLALESLFRPVKGVQSTRLLVKIHNIHWCELTLTHYAIQEGMPRPLFHEVFRMIETSRELLSN